MLLFDQNISPKIVKHTESVFPGSVHVRSVGLEDASDSVIFNYARDEKLHIVTFDADFADISIISGHPPKIIWLRTGNITTLVIHHLLVFNQKEIGSFIADEKAEHGILEIHSV